MEQLNLFQEDKVKVLVEKAAGFAFEEVPGPRNSIPFEWKPPYRVLMVDGMGDLKEVFVG